MSEFERADNNMIFGINILGANTRFEDKLLVHLSTNFTFSFTDVDPNPGSLALFSVRAGPGGAYGWSETVFADGTSTISYTPGFVSPTLFGIDFLLPFSFLGGWQPLDIRVWSIAGIDGQSVGAAMSQTFSVSLLSAELISWDGTRQPAVFDDKGVGTLVGTATTTPEPSTALLTATALVIVGALARRRRSARLRSPATR